MAELRKNKAKQTLNEGGIATVAMGNMSGDMIEFLGPLGFDGMWIEAPSTARSTSRTFPTSHGPATSGG